MVIPALGAMSLDAQVNPNGRIHAGGCLALGPFSHPVTCGDDDDLLTPHIAPSSVQYQAPAVGDAIEYDPGLASTSAYHGPLEDGKPVWRPLHHEPDVAFVTLVDDARALAAPTQNVVIFLATYFEYLGPHPIEAEICAAGGDGKQIWLDTELVYNRMVCFGAGQLFGCGDRSTVLVSPGAHRILVGVWTSGLGFELQLGLRVAGAPVSDAHPDWLFCGTRKPEGFSLGVEEGLFLRRVTGSGDPHGCPPMAGGPLTVTISAQLPDGPDVPLVTDSAFGSFGPSQVLAGATHPGTVTPKVVEPTANPLGDFHDSRVIVSKLRCAEGNGSTAFEPQDGSYTLTNIGEGIWSHRDGLTYAYSRIEGDFSFSAHVKDLRGLPPEAQEWQVQGYIGGLLVRQDFSARSRYAMVRFNNAWRPFDGRLTHGGTDDFPLAPPAFGSRTFYRLTRVGDTFTGFSSEDGESYVRHGSVTWSEGPAAVLVGLAVSSHSMSCADGPAEVVLEQVQLEPTGKRNPISFDPVGVDVTWRDVPRSILRDGLSYTIERPQGDVSFDGRAGDSYIFGAANGRILPPLRDLGLREDPDFEHAHDIGADCVASFVRRLDARKLAIGGAGYQFWTWVNIVSVGTVGDQFTFAYTRVSGDFSARVTVVDRQLAPGSLGGELGIMARQDCSRNSRFSFITDRGANLGDKAFLTYREAHGTSGWAKVENALAKGEHPSTFRLDRCGSVFSAYVLSGAGDWVPMGSHEWKPEAPDSLLVGLAVTSDQGCDVNTITFEDWRLDPGCESPFVRGDANRDGRIDLTDAVVILDFLFLGNTSMLDCRKSADADDNAVVNVSDGVYLLSYQFLGDPPPPAPFPDCGLDAATPDGLGCAFSECL